MSGGRFLNFCCIRRKTCGRCCKAVGRSLRRNILLFSLMVAALIGFVIGVLINDPVNSITNPEKKATVLMLINFPGELFMNMLKMILIPLVVSTLINAVATLNPDVAGRLGRRTLIYYLTTMILAAILGLSLVLSIRPGTSDKPGGQREVDSVKVRNLDSLLDVLRNCFPSNLVEAAVSGKMTSYKSEPAKTDIYNVTGNNVDLKGNEKIVQVYDNGTENITTISKQISPGSDTIPAGVVKSGGMNVIGLTVFSIVLGIVLGRMREKAKPLVEFFSALNEAIMRIVYIIMWIAPLGVCSLVAARVAGMDDILGAMERMGFYILTVIAGLLAHSLVVLPLVFFAVTRQNPFIFMKGLRDALMTAFGISSSAATLPTTIRCVEENNGIDPRISRFMLPLGATVNMDGSALYRVVSVIFIAQLNSVSLSSGEIAVVCLLSIAFAIGSAGIPAAGVETIIVLQAVNLPLHDFGLILAVDWFLDRARTVVNVLGDAMGTGIVYHLSRDDLQTKPLDLNSEKSPVSPENDDTALQLLNV